MRVRALDDDHDWLFGQSGNDYLQGNAAIAQNINTRLNSFLGNCYFDLTAGIDWFNLLGGKDQLPITLAISTTILNTDGVTGLVQLSSDLDSITRNLTVTYKVQTVYSTVSSVFVFDTSIG
jgi:hypothetical protein